MLSQSFKHRSLSILDPKSEAGCLLTICRDIENNRSQGTDVAGDAKYIESMQGLQSYFMTLCFTVSLPPLQWAYCLNK